MTFNNDVIKNDEKAIFALRSLYQKYGYKQYKMSKFEEYDLYAKNKDFLVSDSVITFTDFGGKLMALTGQLTAELFMPLSLTVEYATAVMDKGAHNQVFTTGQSQLFMQPEFQDLSKANDIMSLLTDQKDNLPVLDENTPMQILIGPENVNEALKESSVVIASYDIGDNMRGLVGVVGPTRMDYATVAARLSYFAESLSKMFAKPDQMQLPEAASDKSHKEN